MYRLKLLAKAKQIESLADFKTLAEALRAAGAMDLDEGTSWIEDTETSEERTVSGWRRPP